MDTKNHRINNTNNKTNAFKGKPVAKVKVNVSRKTHIFYKKRNNRINQTTKDTVHIKHVLLILIIVNIMHLLFSFNYST